MRKKVRERVVMWDTHTHTHNASTTLVGSKRVKWFDQAYILGQLPKVFNKKLLKLSLGLIYVQV